MSALDTHVARRFLGLVQRLRTSRSGGTTSQLAGIGADLADAEHIERVRATIDEAVDRAAAPETAKARAAEVGAAYLDLNDTGKRALFHLLADSYGVSEAAVTEAIEARADRSDLVASSAADAALREALRPSRMRLLRAFNGLDAGVKFLVDLRADLRRLKAAEPSPQLRVMDTELRDLLASWFDVGLLHLERITWETPAAILEKLIGYEAVHDITSWDDLKRRLAPDRRLYAFFHPAMPDEPLIFVEVGLTVGIADAIEPLIDPHAFELDPDEVDTAIFYSISNCQQGLAGVPLGDFLIKRVVAELQQALPHIQTFSTLSPMPGFRAWVDRLVDDAQLRHAETEPITRIASTPEWWTDPALVEEVRPALVGLAARYLVNERKDGRVVDPVARFHLANGARVERVLFLANPTSVGQARGLGMMVNYRYLPDDLDDNQDAYLNHDEVVTSPAVQDLLTTQDR